MVGIVRYLGLVAVSFFLLLSLGHAQGRAAAQPVTSATLAAKKPVFAGACKTCPWGILGTVTADALKYYGYETQMCWVCFSSYGPREMADKTKPVVPPGAPSRRPEYAEPPPDAVPDISATSETNLINAWNGQGDYAKDNKQRRNYRVVAVVRSLTYMLAAANKKSGITSLDQIKDRTQPTWIVVNGGNGDVDIILDHYGISEEALKAKGGGFVEGRDREKRAAADVFIGTGLMTNVPEQNLWYEVSQLDDLVFLDFEQPVIAQLSERPGWERGTVALGFFRGVDRPIPTAMRTKHFIYVRDETPDDFAYTVAKALDEHRLLFQAQIMPWYYDSQTVADSKVIPMHPGAMKYYRERGYVK